MKDSTKRFSDRVEDYIKYRPNYPTEIVASLEKKFEINNSAIVADIGSGTGISSLPFLESNYKVIGIEPNLAMREASDTLLSQFSNFSSLNGTAENTSLPDHCIDLILCGQAFHWFNHDKAKAEFNRIVKPNGHIVLMWNSRNDSSNFLQEYEKTLYDNLEEYKKIDHRNVDDEKISKFFSPRIMKKYALANKQVFYLEGLKGRLRSSSYCPKSGELYKLMMKKMEYLFEKYQKNDQVEFEYDTQIYCC